MTSCETITPLMREREPDSVISLEITSSSPIISIPCSSKSSFEKSFSVLSVNSMMARVFPVFMTSLLALAPNARSIALIMILFPAPVSPVMTLKPLSNAISSSSINIKSFIQSVLIILSARRDPPL